MDSEVRAYLDALSDHPSGDTEAWRARYAPLIAEVIEHDPKPDARLSVVLVAWRASDGVIEALDHVHATRGVDMDEVQIVLVDNGGLGGILDELSRRVDLHIRMKCNVLLSPARNTGVAWSRGELVVFLDDDGLIAPDYLARARRYFEDPFIMAVRSRIVAHKHPYFTTLAGHYDRGPEPVDDCLVTEGSAVIRREAYMSVGGFADHLYGHEGIEVTFRLKQQDPRNRTIYAPDVVMAHDYIHTWRKFFEKRIRYATIDNATHTRAPALQAFMDDYFAQRFDRTPLPPDELAARLLLKLLEKALVLAVKIRDALRPIKVS